MILRLKIFSPLAIFILLTFANPTLSVAQVQTEVPAVIPNAKPATVEHIKIHGTSLEGNLEGDAVDRDVFVFLPPSYAQDKLAATRLSMRCMATPSAPSSGRTKSTCRRPSKALSRRAQKR